LHRRTRGDQRTLGTDRGRGDEKAGDTRSVGSHASTTLTAWSVRRRRNAAVGSAPATRTAGGDVHAFRQRAVDRRRPADDGDDLVVVEQRQRRFQAVARAIVLELATAARAAVAGSAAARMRAQTHQSWACERWWAMTRRHATTNDAVRRRNRRARRPLRPRAVRRRRCAG
jgi:hypothetical protein